MQPCQSLLISIDQTNDIRQFLSNILDLAKLKINLTILLKISEPNLGYIANKSQFLIAVLGDFNARMEGWYQNNIATFKGCKIDIEISQFDLSQIMKKQHIF